MYFKIDITVLYTIDKKDGLVKKEGFIDYSNVKLVEKSVKDKKVNAKKAATTIAK